MTGNIAGHASKALERAVGKERAQLQRERERLERHLAALRAELQTIDDALQAVNAHDALLMQIVPDDPARPASVAAIASDAMILRGRDIRRVAVRLLAEHHGTAHPIHYRAWFELLARNGYVVLGQRPLATFLTNVCRSAVVVRAEQSGTYELDEHALARVRRELDEHQIELADLVSVIACGGGVPSPALVERRTRLIATVRRLERERTEADEAFVDEPRSAAA